MTIEKIMDDLKIVKGTFEDYYDYREACENCECGFSRDAKTAKFIEAINNTAVFVVDRIRKFVLSTDYDVKLQKTEPGTHIDMPSPITINLHNMPNSELYHHITEAILYACVNKAFANSDITNIKDGMGVILIKNKLTHAVTKIDLASDYQKLEPSQQSENNLYLIAIHKAVEKKVGDSDPAYYPSGGALWYGIIVSDVDIIARNLNIRETVRDIASDIPGFEFIDHDDQLSSGMYDSIDDEDGALEFYKSANSYMYLGEHLEWDICVSVTYIGETVDIRTNTIIQSPSAENATQD